MSDSKRGGGRGEMGETVVEPTEAIEKRIIENEALLEKTKKDFEQGAKQHPEIAALFKEGMAERRVKLAEDKWELAERKYQAHGLGNRIPFRFEMGDRVWVSGKNPREPASASVYSIVDTSYNIVDSSGETFFVPREVIEQGMFEHSRETFPVKVYDIVTFPDKPEIQFKIRSITSSKEAVLAPANQLQRGVSGMIKTLEEIRWAIGADIYLSLKLRNAASEASLEYQKARLKLEAIRLENAPSLSLDDLAQQDLGGKKIDPFAPLSDWRAQLENPGLLQETLEIVKRQYEQLERDARMPLVDFQKVNRMEVLKQEMFELKLTIVEQKYEGQRMTPSLDVGTPFRVERTEKKGLDTGWQIHSYDSGKDIYILIKPSETIMGKDGVGSPAAKEFSRPRLEQMAWEQDILGTEKPGTHIVLNEKEYTVLSSTPEETRCLGQDEKKYTFTSKHLSLAKAQTLARLQTSEELHRQIQLLRREKEKYLAAIKKRPE